MKPVLGQQRSPRREGRGEIQKIVFFIIVVVLGGFLYTLYRSSPGFHVAANASPRQGLFSRGFILTDVDGNRMPFADYGGKVILAVNVASLCGYTKANYEQMAKLHTQYAPSGLVILAFPCNQFGNQEPGSNSEVKSFAQSRGAQYPIMNKIMVNGPQTNDLWAAMKKEANVTEIKWNFEKFLIGRQGQLIAHHLSPDEPLSFEREIVAALEG